ncbi:MAG: hypothetical protein R3F54_03680 [Alphaproteobacteria bacterium]
MRLARPGVWPAVKGLIVFDGRVWLTNSQPFEDNNAADIYSYDPESRELRFERGLFSQDVGVPAVVDGRLLLPLEDPRFNLSAGEYAITDGQAWRWHRLPEGLAFHTHAIGACGDDLLAVTGAWEGQLHLSSDGGRTWRLARSYPANEAAFSRLVAVAAFKERCFVGASAFGRRGAKLLEWQGGALHPVTGWPEGNRTDRLTPWKGLLLGLNDTNAGASLHAYDGENVRRIVLPTTDRVRNLAADGETLWMVAGNSLWRTADAVRWQEVQRFDETPIAVAASGGSVFVGTFAKKGGSLFGPKRAIDMHGAAAAKPLAPQPRRRVDATMWADVEKKIGGYLEASGPGDDAGRLEALSRSLRRLTTVADPAIGERLAAHIDALDLRSGLWRFVSPRSRRSQILGWHLLSAIAVNGHGHVPVDLLAASLSSWRNATKKNLDPPIAALATVGWLDQHNGDTLDALIRRLSRTGIEPWEIGDITAALTALTGQSFAHDVDRWQAWWSERKRR